MNKKFVKLIICMLVCIFGYNLNVFADATSVEEGSADPYNLKSNYNKGLSKVTVSSSNATVTLYGKSECSGSSCTITYAASGNDSFKDALARTVTCSNGETHITYQMGGTGKTNYNESNSSGYSGTAYWSEDYFVTCTNESSGSTNVELGGTSGSGSSGGSTSSGNTSGGSSGDTSNNSSNQSGSSGSTSQNNNYQSSSTVNNENTGVKTYFIVLGLVAVISYVFMLCVKKYNLFKNI